MDSRDEVTLDRPAIVLANRLGSVLAPDVFLEKWPVPFEAFPAYIRDGGRLLEEANAALFIWGVLGVFEGREDEFARAKRTKRGTHRDFREEMPIVPLLPELWGRPDHRGWAVYETVLARWLNPILTTESYASNFQSYFAGVMSLLWVRYHLKRLNRDTLLKTYFGETLSVPVPVE